MFTVKNFHVADVCVWLCRHRLCCCAHGVNHPVSRAWKLNQCMNWHILEGPDQAADFQPPSGRICSLLHFISSFLSLWSQYFEFFRQNKSFCPFSKICLFLLMQKHFKIQTSNEGKNIWKCCLISSYPFFEPSCHEQVYFFCFWHAWMAHFTNYSWQSINGVPLLPHLLCFEPLVLSGSVGGSWVVKLWWEQ